jgi:hypothetical protein
MILRTRFAAASFRSALLPEKTITKGIMRHQARLLSAEPDFLRLLNSGEPATKAPAKAVANNPSSTFIAKAPSRVQESEGDDRQWHLTVI